MLNAERDFEPDGAFGRIAHADDLVFALPIFFEPLWLAPDLTDQRLQLTIVDKLTGYLLRHRMVDAYELACPLLDIRCGIDRAKADLRWARVLATAPRPSTR